MDLVSRRKLCRALITIGFASIDDIGARSLCRGQRGIVRYRDFVGASSFRCLDLTIGESGLFTLDLRLVTLT